VTNALFLDVRNYTNIQDNTKLIAKGLMDYYQGDTPGGTVGMFTFPYYWWEAGGAWGSLIDYSYYMEDHSYDQTILDALVYQTGDNDNYMPLNQTTTEGNDDQGFWGIAVMAAAEKNFTAPSDPNKQWLALAQAVFNTMSVRWDMTECNGGLRWQIFQWNSGYDYKNSVSNGCLFHIGARLARFTGNTTYVDWAEKVWDWMIEVELLNEINGYWFVHDGVTVGDGCHNITPYQWTYNQGLFMSGCAYLYNHTKDEKWRNRTLDLLHGATVFFAKVYGDSRVMYEAACQPVNSTAIPTCNTDQRSFKAYFSRFLGLTSLMLPETRDVITKYLTDSANAAAATCVGGTDHHTCGLAWTNGSYWDGYWGLGEQMSALEVIVNLRVHDKPGPLVASDPGTSKGNPAAGFAQNNFDALPLILHQKDRAGAGVITAIIGVSIIGCGVWLLL
jgi:mannan endo-1,6-alpha-mannosidase